MTLLGDVETLPGHRLVVPVPSTALGPAQRSWPQVARPRLAYDASDPVRVPRPGLLAALGLRELPA